ncbi:MAG: hypothetical protein A2836_00630 [Candidatus Taylorbacteria bacterium RIFCSPHIGHO2_01_FULL_45_63]|uniref:Uncharacterized protein n=1 Tax=Candidatus Taylorbacteria bacterium RIFCSPHIGHO2_02_FULL_45_35 TaxID=1802311 RepID=A0A1G2MTF4_9BACT|nr:MAG: hypothetical protein A2836_00630 [Candidatus Taylorbacteria bacterium RIFCSPHIGHO2_01_FULL_45_63]OHA27126.1 MAG: hypothetical protein A3D56_03330 [Candidatus Taylorbacteria bacterium RIFCSPHIGHO2_02_FULL_45_35]
MDQKNTLLFASILGVFVLVIGGFFAVKGLLNRKSEGPAPINTPSAGTLGNPIFGDFGGATEAIAPTTTDSSASGNDFFYYGDIPQNQTQTGGVSSGGSYTYQGYTPTSGGATETPKTAEEIKAEQEASTLKGTITISYVTHGWSYGSQSGSDPAAGEYVTLVADRDNTEKILLSGMELRSPITGKGAKIGNGVYLPYQSQLNTSQPIFLSPGETAYIATGRSPIGISFRLNKCTGFYEQFQDFVPGLQQECPAISDYGVESVTVDNPNALNDACIDYIRSFQRCAVPVNPYPKEIDRECQIFIEKRAAYNYCVSSYKNTADFYKPEWRIFLGRTELLWKDRRELIKLLDQNGKTVATYTY